MIKNSIKPLDSQVSQEPSRIPRHPCVLNIVSLIGMGKSTLLIRLITEDVFFRGKFHRIVIFSPTCYLYPKWTSVLSIKGVLKKCPHEMAEETIDLVAPQRKKRRFSGRIPAEDVYTEYDEEVLKNLVESQKDYQEIYGKAGMPSVLVIFEDAAGLNLFSGKRGTAYIKLITTLRHCNISIWHAIQSYKLIPRTVRINCSNLIFFRICNKQELRKLHEEFPMVGDFNAWFNLFEKLTKEDYSFVHLNAKSAPFPALPKLRSIRRSLNPFFRNTRKSPL